MAGFEIPLIGVLVGCGYTSGYQLSAWSSIDSVRIAAVSSLHREDAEKRAAEHDIPTVFDDYTTMLDEVRPDFVDIATPASTHLELVVAAAERGVHVLCQKPMATSRSEVGAMLQICRSNGVNLTINENARFQPWFRELGRIVGAGTLGRLVSLHIDSRARLTLPDPDFGEQQHLAVAPQLVIMDLGVHHLDVARYLLGEADTVFAATRRVSSGVAGEDVALLVTRHGDVTATVDMSWAAALYPPRERVAWSEVRLEGDEGTAVLSYDGCVEVWTPSGLLSSAKFSAAGVQEGYEAMQRHFVDSLVGSVRAETDGRETSKTMDLVFAAYESAATRRAVSLGEISPSVPDG